MAMHSHDMRFGAKVGPEGTRFRLWAPDCRTVALVLDDRNRGREITVSPDAAGWCDVFVSGAGAGTRYGYRIDGDLCVPDPASRFQPDDIHGLSEVIDPAAYSWRCPEWSGRPWEETVLYELHVGAFTAAGTFRAVEERLDYLADLGVTAIELMPVADTPGRFDWGYSGVLPFAPDARYGRPEDLKSLVDAAHARGLMVFLDVVYNHFGPEGDYLHLYARRFFATDRSTPWGGALNFDGEGSTVVREFFIDNALFWIGEYRIDGLRLDAVHAIEDNSPRHILDELADRVRDMFGAERRIHLVLENDRNQVRFLGRDRHGGVARYAAQWNDDIHHALHVLTTGETDGYYADYADDPVGRLGRCLSEGFAYQGEASAFRRGEPRGERSAELPLTAFVNFLQNHDQVGNRAFGERITLLAPAAAVRAAVAVLLLAPSPPLLFMGEEWGSRQPFTFFCDLGGDMRAAVQAGRLREFASFPQFADPDTLARIPDATSPETFAASVLEWGAIDDPAGREWFSFYQRLLTLRRSTIVPRLSGLTGQAGQFERWGERGLTVHWRLGDGSRLGLVANLNDRPDTPPNLPEGELLFGVGVPASVATGGGDLPGWSVLWLIAEPAAALSGGPAR